MRVRLSIGLWVVAAAAILGACGDAMEGGPGGPLPYASELVSFDPGEGAGHGQADLPDVVLGPPKSTEEGGSTSNVLSLGAGGSVILGFGDRSITDGPGDDFIVFENAFYTEFEDDGVWEELGRVSVSRDGETWHRFECNNEPVESDDGPYRWPGCAGWTPTKAYDSGSTTTLDPTVTGGNSFDLSDLGLDRINYVRITDLTESTDLESKAGFDLDAVGIMHVGR